MHGRARIGWAWSGCFVGVLGGWSMGEYVKMVREGVGKEGTGNGSRAVRDE